MRIFDGKIYRDMTAQELAAREQEARKAAVIEANRPLTEGEVTRLLITQQVNSLTVDDHTALRMKDFYPQWELGAAYTQGHKVRRSGKLWRCLQGHTAAPGWEPEISAALWESINETHAGTLEDPIPYDSNLALEAGKHYIQESEIYLCTQATGGPVFHPLRELVGLYVEAI